MSKAIIFFVYFISMILLTHQTPIQGSSSPDRLGYLLCSKGSQRCGNQCYDPETHVCLPPEGENTNQDEGSFASSMTSLPLPSTTNTASTEVSSTTSTIASKASPTTSTIASKVSPTAVGDRKLKGNNSRRCRTKNGTRGQKECLCGKKIYDPQIYKCRNDKLICKKPGKNCQDKDITKLDPRAMAMEAGIEFGAKAGSDLIEIGTNQFKEFIENINQVSEKREEFTEKTVKHLQEVTNHKKSILVIDNKWSHQISIGDSYIKAHVEVPKPVSGTHGFDIYVFDEGIVTKHGDGGFVNWRYFGNTELIDGNASHVRFKKIE